ncbi:hypothetical protein HOY82DRAFT_643573, partial [Tuber indicum]
MPRALPWALNRPPTSASSSSKPSTKPPPPKTKPKHNPSTPPPHRNAPKREGSALDEAIIEYMTPQDDIYIMVEDELLTTAQLYTRSLHRAEYSRLQAAAALKNAHRIKDIQRPVDGVTRMSREAIMRGRRGARVAALGLDGGGSSSSDEDEEGWGKGALGRLMSGRSSSSGYVKGRLGERWKGRGGGGGGGGTRAAAGFTDAQVVGGGATVGGVKVKKEKEGRNASSCPKIKQEQDSDTDTPSDDDLDAPVHSFRTPSIPPPLSSISFANNPNQAKPIKRLPPSQPLQPPNPCERRDSIPPFTSTSSTSFSNTSTTSTYHTTSAPQSRATSFSKIIDLDDDPLFRLPKPPEKSSTYRGKSMAARRRAEGENSRSGTGGGDFGNKREEEKERRLFDSLKSF